jgi:gliding motility-associated lipoprotein GldD
MKYFFAFVLIMLLASSCDNNYVPKPRGYFRIDIPEKNYVPFDSAGFPFVFQRPEYAVYKADAENPGEPYWMDLFFIPFNASLHLSYKKVENNLDVFLEDSHTFVNKHIPKATAIEEKLYINHPEKVYGLVYTILGNDAASPLQFYLTDSTKHFMRGAVYFNFKPDNDSLKPVIDRITEDVSRMIETFEWR